MRWGYLNDAAVWGGGAAASGASPPKDKLFWYRDYLIRKLEESDISVHLSTAATFETLMASHPSVVILAT